MNTENLNTMITGVKNMDQMNNEQKIKLSKKGKIHF